MSQEWAVGVTTCPQRRGALLPRTLASLRNAGWGRPHLFVDGCADGASWLREFGLPVTCRAPAARVSGNWFLALWELYWRQPHADRYMICQDDVVVYRNLRQYLEAVEYPDRSYLNLYTQRWNEGVIHGKKKGTWHPAAELPHDRGSFVEEFGVWKQGGKGALALVFDQAAVRALLSHPHMLEKPRCPEKGWRSIDGAVVESMNQSGFREMVHCPSLVQHLGHESTILLPTGPGGELQPKPRPPGALTFMGEHFDAMRLLEGNG